MAGISFVNYVVDEMQYKTNSSFKRSDEQQISIIEKITAEIAIDKRDAVVSLSAELEEDENNPFSFFVKIVGVFEYNKNESGNQSFNKFLETNAIAILFPYLRAVVSDITSKSNIYPNYNMPVRNIVTELSDKGLIKVTDYNEYEN